ncbi:hypothetical protein BCV69DRAFT_85525 [Microstroma glucosiphilum]|uniref:Uncharacterized protein n=1 Tax=Pseudomicrostroma glucosiphilum TaxID=1684307 RepID=A0A316TXI8_9BASI|nr:hypothetical protein BCV69DRAFT_85525 [Pseudomicrostroma glucosiphilum]PWN18119.1 hypothetical protein BCV69DRAFT_85525 [Pseudomicrostroma glucosiphilum]
MSFSSFHPVFLDNHTQSSASTADGDVRSPSTSSTSSASSQSSPFGGGFSYTRNQSRGAANGGMLASAQNWGAASESPASEAYPSTTSPSPHRSSPSTSLGNTYEEVAAKQFEATDMSGQGGVSTNSASTTQPFSTEGNYGSHHFGQQGVFGGGDMGETWYDPEGADRYSAAQAFLTANPSYSGGPSMMAAASYAPPSTRSFAAQSIAANQNHQASGNPASSYSGLRDPFAPNINNAQPSPFASPAMSAHHRTSSFGSDFGSPPPSLFTTLSQQSFHDGQPQQQQPGAAWMQQRESLGGLQGLQNMRLSEGSPFVGQTSDQQLNGNVYGYPSEAASSTSSLHSQLSHHSGYHDATSAPEGSLEQLIAEQQFAQQQSDGFSSFAVNDLSMGEGTAINDKFDPSVNMLTFEQVLEQMRSGNDSQPVAPLLQHPNRSVPNFSSTSPWPPSSASAESSGGSDSLQQGSAAGSSYRSPEALQAQPNPSTNIPRPDAPLRNPTREDSFDKLKKYLKLDVNMAYAGPMNDSPTTSIMRKRSASDAGPMASAVTVKGRGSGGNGTGLEGEDFAQLGAKLGLDFNGVDGKSGEQLTVDGSTTVMAMQHQPVPTFGQNIQQWAHQADGHRDLHPSAASGGGSSSRSSSVSWGETMPLHRQGELPSFNRVAQLAVPVEAQQAGVSLMAIRALPVAAQSLRTLLLPRCSAAVAAPISAKITTIASSKAKT